MESNQLRNAKKNFRVTEQRLFRVKLKKVANVDKSISKENKTSRIIDISQNQTYFNSSQTNYVGFE